jgi:hypothetical protein
MNSIEIDATTAACETCGAKGVELFLYTKPRQHYRCVEHRREYADGRIPAPALHPVCQMELEHHAKAIRDAAAITIKQIIEIGRRLTRAKELCGHGNWLLWLEENFGWTDRHALNFMRVYELSLKSEIDFGNLELPISGLYLLAAPSTSDEAREAVIDAAAKGEKITVAKVKEAVAATKPKKKAAESESPIKPKAPVSARDIALEGFDAHVLELVRLTKGQKPQRFAKTAVSQSQLIGLTFFLQKLAAHNHAAEQQ